MSTIMTIDGFESGDRRIIVKVIVMITSF